MILSLGQVFELQFFPTIFPACNLAVLFDPKLRPQAKGRFLFFSPTAMVRYLRGSAVLLFSSILTCFVGIQKDGR